MPQSSRRHAQRPIMPDSNQASLLIQLLREASSLRMPLTPVIGDRALPVRGSTADGLSKAGATRSCLRCASALSQVFIREGRPPVQGSCCPCHSSPPDVLLQADPRPAPGLAYMLAQPLCRHQLHTPAPAEDRLWLRNSCTPLHFNSPDHTIRTSEYCLLHPRANARARNISAQCSAS